MAYTGSGAAHPALPRAGAAAGAEPAASPWVAPGWAFATVVAFSVVDYGRPQDVIPGAALLRPSLLMSILLTSFLVLRTGPAQWSDSKITLYAALLGFMTLWVPLAHNNFWAFQIWLTLTQLFAFSLAFIASVDTIERFRRYILILILCTAFQAWWGISHAGQGTGSFLGDENDFCQVMNMMIPFALMAAREIPQTLWRVACYVALALYLSAVVTSESRGGFVGLLVTGAALVMLSRHRVRILATAAVACGLMLALAPSEYFDEMRTIQDPDDPTRLSRLKMWKVARATFADNPILGVGQGNINWRIQDYETFDPVKERSYAGHAVHSLYFTLLPELGLLGVVLYGGMALLILRDCWRILRSRDGPPSRLDPYARAILCALAAFLACGLFISTLYYPHFYYFLAMSTVLRKLRERELAGLTV